MDFDDKALTLLIEAGLSDEEIIEYVHHNTKPADLYGAVAEVVTKVLLGDEATLKIIEHSDSSATQKFFRTLKSMFGSDDKGVTSS